VHVRKSDLRSQIRHTESGAPELIITSAEIEITTVAMVAQIAVDLATRLADEAGRDITPEATILMKRLAKFTGR